MEKYVFYITINIKMLMMLWELFLWSYVVRRRRTSFYINNYLLMKMRIILMKNWMTKITIEQSWSCMVLVRKTVFYFCWCFYGWLWMWCASLFSILLSIFRKVSSITTSIFGDFWWISWRKNHKIKMGVRLGRSIKTICLEIYW